MHKFHAKDLPNDVPRDVDEELENAFKGLTFKVRNLSITIETLKKDK